MDINTKKIKKNAFRVTKVRGKTASRIRIPGGHITADSLITIAEIAQNYGNGTIHITNRQGVEVPGIDFADMENVNAKLQPIIDAFQINQEAEGQGYPAAGTRNIIGCIGNRVCPYACYDTTNFVEKMEHLIYPNNLHFKVAFTGCFNDCAKVRMHDFGIIGMTEPEYDKNRCVSCEACVKACNAKSVGALSVVNHKIVRDEKKCVGCGVCVINCPTRAWTRSKEKYYRLTLFGRSGKKNPRLAEDFIKWADEESILKIVKNTYAYVGEYIDKNAPEGKEHIGYIVDRTGMEAYKKWALKEVSLSEKAEIEQALYWKGKRYD